MNRYTWSRYKYPRGYVTDPFQEDSLYLGDMESDPKGDLVEIPYTMYSDYSGGVVERSNCETFLKMFGDEKGVWPVYGGYGTTGIVVHSSLLEKPEPSEEWTIAEQIQEVLQELERYPVIDEEDMSGLEFELEEESWESWVRDDLAWALDRAEKPYPTDDGEFKGVFLSVITENDIYFVHEGATGPWIDIDEIVEHWPVTGGQQ